MLFGLKEETLTHATTWVNPEDTMQSEISQLQRDEDCIPLR